MNDNVKVELLLKIQNRVNNIFNKCDKIIDLLNLNDSLNIEKVGSNYKIFIDEQKFDFAIAMEPSGDVFSITVNSCGTYDQSDLPGILDGLTEIVREIKITVSQNLKNCSYEILWDDAGIYYAIMAYPMIIKIENLMRKLITKFMLVPVGMEFFNNIPEDINVREVKDSDSGFLHNLDFIELSNYIFTPRPLKSIENLTKIINSLDENKLPDNVNVLDYQYRSYWDRYFKDIIEDATDIDGETIKKQWEELYKLRCNIAHSRFLLKDEYAKVKSICERLENVFTSALKNLSNIVLSAESKESISENIIAELDGSNWSDVLYEIITENFEDEFTLKQVYAFEPILKAQYPNNNTIQASIRRNLQKLRNKEKIDFLDNGRYRLIKAPEENK